VVFAGDGQILIQEMEAAVVQGREMILLAGSGRTTDAVLAARAGQATDNPRIVEIANASRITGFEINRDPAELREIIRRKLFL
jgi:SLOG in TRPM, prokaryote